jgi:predicted esterase
MFAIPAAKLCPADRAFLATNSFVAAADFAAGAWEGMILAGEWGIFNVRFQLAQGPQVLKGSGTLFGHLTEEQVAQAKDLKSDSTFCDSFAAELACAGVVTGGSLRVEAKAKIVFAAPERKQKFAELALEIPLRAPGWGIGECSLDGETGTAYVARDVVRVVQPEPPPKGQTVKLACDDGRYHYTLYVSKSYDPAKPAPLLINDNPGKNAQPLSPAMAEELGWVMAGLTEAGNDASWDVCFANSVSTLFDLRRKLNIDPGRVYFSGFSGGARRASYRAVVHVNHCAGLFCIGAGYMGGYAPKPYAPPTWMPVFFVVGATDMNNGEVEKGLFPREKQRLQHTQLIVHPGGHSWGRAEDHVAGLKWLNERYPDVAAFRAPAAGKPAARPPRG